MRSPRGYFGAAVIGETIYVAGGYPGGTVYLSTVEAGVVVPASPVPSVPTPSSPEDQITGRLKDGKLIVAPNVLEWAAGNAGVNIVAKGKPGAAVTFRIYTEAGVLVRTLTAVANGGGITHPAFDGTNEGGVKLGSGAYWVVASGGGVSDRKLLLVVQRRKR
jgi:hypothetical protein